MKIRFKPAHLAPTSTKLNSKPGSRLSSYPKEAQHLRTKTRSLPIPPLPRLPTTRSPHRPCIIYKAANGSQQLVQAKARSPRLECLTDQGKKSPESEVRPPFSSDVLQDRKRSVPLSLFRSLRRLDPSHVHGVPRKLKAHEYGKDANSRGCLARDQCYSAICTGRVLKQSGDAARERDDSTGFPDSACDLHAG